MIVEGQIHGGLTEGLLSPSCRRSRTTKAATYRAAPSWTTWCYGGRNPALGDRQNHHAFAASSVGAREWRVAERWLTAAFVNAVVDALSHLGVSTSTCRSPPPWKVWNILKEKGSQADMAVKIEKTFQVNEARGESLVFLSDPRKWHVRPRSADPEQ